MKSKEQFTAEFADQLAGFLLAAFAQEENTRVDMAMKGRQMQARLNSVRPLLGKMWDFINETVVETLPPPRLGIDEQADILIRQYGSVPPTVQKAVVEKLRKAFNGKAEK